MSVAYQTGMSSESLVICRSNDPLLCRLMTKSEKCHIPCNFTIRGHIIYRSRVPYFFRGGGGTCRYIWYWSTPEVQLSPCNWYCAPCPITLLSTSKRLSSKNNAKYAYFRSFDLASEVQLTYDRKPGYRWLCLDLHSDLHDTFFQRDSSSIMDQTWGGAPTPRAVEERKMACVGAGQPYYWWGGGWTGPHL